MDGAIGGTSDEAGWWLGNITTFVFTFNFDLGDLLVDIVKMCRFFFKVFRGINRTVLDTGTSRPLTLTTI